MGMKLFISILALLAVGVFAENSVWSQPIYSTEDTALSTDSAKVQSISGKEEPYILVNKRSRLQKVSVSEYFAVDSIPIYDKKIEQAESSHETLSGLGTVFLLSGALALGGSLVMLTNDNSDVQVTGVICLILSPYLITPGIILKAIGSKKGRNADRFRRERDDYIAKKHQYQISVAPTFNLQNQSTGARLSLSF